MKEILKNKKAKSLVLFTLPDPYAENEYLECQRDRTVLARSCAADTKRNFLVGTCSTTRLSRPSHDPSGLFGDVIVLLPISRFDVLSFCGSNEYNFSDSQMVTFLSCLCDFCPFIQSKMS